jgi:nicotinamidase-related amidase
MTRRALLLIDVINDFFHPKGVNYHSEYDEILDWIKKVLTLARKKNLMVIHVRENHPSQHLDDYEFEKLPVHCTSDSSSIDWAPGIEVLENEFIIEKRRYSAFFETGLNLLLKEAKIDQVIIVGVKTHVCIRATTQDAFGWGYRPMLVKEAVGSNYHHLHEASLEDIRRYMGSVLSYRELELLLNED